MYLFLVMERYRAGGTLTGGASAVSMKCSVIFVLPSCVVNSIWCSFKTWLSAAWVTVFRHIQFILATALERHGLGTVIVLYQIAGGWACTQTQLAFLGGRLPAAEGTFIKVNDQAMLGKKVTS